jgi:uncharacterized protein involved in exopolysaccharide biosynthesis
LKEIASVLVRRKWQISTVFLLVIAGVAFATFLAPKQYATHMKILVKNERADMIVSAAGGDASGYHGEVSESQINSEIELLNSNNLLQQVVTKCGLERLEHGKGSTASERTSVSVEKAVLRLHHDLKIAAVRKANIIQVDYLARDPRLAASVLQQLAESYLDAHLKVHSTPGTYNFFSSQATHYRNELKAAEAKLAKFRHDTNVVMLAQQKDIVLQKSADSEATLMEAEASLEEYTDKIADTRKQLEAASPRIVTQKRAGPNQYSVERLGTMLAELQNRRTQLLMKFRSDDRLVREADQEIAETNAALEKAKSVTTLEQNTDVNPVQQSIAIDLAKQQSALVGIAAKRQALAQQTQTYRRQLMELANATAAYDDLLRDQKEAEDNYLLYAKKTEEARIAESLDRQKIANVAIAETPVVPHLPSKPNVRLNLALGTLFAAFLSLGLAFTVEYFSDTVEHASDLEELTGLPVLATAYSS